MIGVSATGGTGMAVTIGEPAVGIDRLGAYGVPWALTFSARGEGG
jgi:hypothetical protein